MQSSGTNHLSMNEFRDALTSASPGSTIVYATGDISYSAPGNAELEGVRTLAMDGQIKGEIFLTQRPTSETFVDFPRFQGGRSFEYRATKAARSA